MYKTLDEIQFKKKKRFLGIMSCKVKHKIPSVTYIVLIQTLLKHGKN